MLHSLRPLGLALTILGVWAGSALAQAGMASISAYSDLDLDECTVTSSDDFGSTWACPGYKGIPVKVSEGDLRFTISYGLTSTEEMAASQTLGPFNTLGPRIEWRLKPAAGTMKPIATIVRYYVQRMDQETGEPLEQDGQVLVVTRLEQGATCQVAWIDALANPNANELARQAADDLAEDFDCADEPKIVGKFEAWER